MQQLRRSPGFPLIYIMCIAAAAIFLFSTHAYPQGQTYFSVVAYNVENAFDTIHDEGFNDYAYLPEGENRWHRYRLFQKLNGIAKVIATIDQERPVNIIGLCEVENDTVLTYLTKRTPLNTLGYKYVMTHSQDRRGVDVALVYQPMGFRLLSHEGLRARTSTPTRDILHVRGITHLGDTLDVYVVHAPSKLGGAAASRNRQLVNDRLFASIDSVISSRKDAGIIVMGDFNDEMKRPRGFLRRGFRDMAAGLTPGTYKYKGFWTTIDHIFIRMPNPDRRLESGILSAPFLLEPDKTHGGSKPFRTFYGPRYNRGFSDHLPVWARIWK